MQKTFIWLALSFATLTHAQDSVNTDAQVTNTTTDTPTFDSESGQNYEEAYAPFPIEPLPQSNTANSGAAQSFSQDTNNMDSTQSDIASTAPSTDGTVPNTSLDTIEQTSPTDAIPDDPGVPDTTDDSYTPATEQLDDYSEEAPAPHYVSLPDSNNPALLDLLGQFSGGVMYRGEYIKIHSGQGINDFYASLNYPLVWTANGHPNRQAVELLAQIRHADAHALRPEVYHANSVTGIDGSTTINDVAQFDVLLTDAFLRLKEHLTNGIVNPKSQFSTWTQPKKSINYTELYLQIHEGTSVEQAFHINNPEYYVLQREYASLLGGPPKVETGQVIVPNVRMRYGDSNEAIEALRQRLNLSEGSTYDDELMVAIKQFQRENGLGADGIVGPRTLAKINGEQAPRGSASKLNKLKINMERARWQNLPANSPYIWVNIPAFNMAVRQGKQTLFTSNVIVGKAARKTPIFSDRLESVVLNPYWNVPKTIFKEDKLPVLKRNRNAFKGMQVLRGGKPINRSAVNWQNGGGNVRLRQLPGPNNPLGRMKFLFPNRHAIYLHDTNKRNLFKRNKRTFSSGCVRVEKALDLASFLLKHKGYNQSKIKSTWKGNKERWINVKESLGYPVHISYFTAWADSNGRVHYSSDVYGYDRNMLRAYDNALNLL